MRILLIDDTQLNITLLQHIIKKIPEYQSVAFADPIQALDWCRDNEPDLVIVNYMMQNMNGLEFAQQFRGFANYEDIPILMITAIHETTVRHKALMSGVTDFLNSPLDNSEFVARARNMLTLRQSQKKIMDRSAWLADEVRKATIKIKLHEKETFFCLAKAAEYRDAETVAHIQRVAYFAKHIAQMMGLSIQLQTLVFEAAPMHDIGKVGIPETICLNQNILSDEEFNIMKQHTMIGHDLLSESDSPLLQAAAEIAYSHHEKYNGTGYPRGLAGEDIPLFGRIVAVADVFDALTSERPYRKAWSINDASNFIRNESGKHFDPSCVSAFFSAFEEILMIKNTRGFRF